MNAWQRFARQRLARSRWNSDPTALEPADTQAFEQAWQRQCRMEQAIVARVPESDIPAALLENIAASLAVWLDEGEFTPPERAAIVLHHARLEVGFTDIARQAPQPDLSTVQAWYLRHQTQFMRPEQRLTRHLLLTVDGDREAVHQRILACIGKSTPPGTRLLRWLAATPTAQAPWKRAVWAGLAAGCSIPSSRPRCFHWRKTP